MKTYKKYTRKIWAAIHGMEIRGMIDKPNKYAGVEDIKIGLTELEKAFEQEIRNESAKPK